MSEVAPFKQCIERLKNLKLGARGTLVTVSSTKSSKLNTTVESYGDIVEVTINIAGGSKTWQILFDTNNPSFCPDVIFDCDDDNFFPDIASLKSFSKWDCKSVGALAALVHELYQEYVIHQLECVKKYSQLGEEMEKLLKSKYGEHCEAAIQKNGPGTFNDVVKVIVPINVDYSRLPPYIKLKNPGESSCRLCISFEPPNLSKVTPTLELTPDVRSALCRIRTLRIPSFDKSLFSYVNRIQTLVETTVNETCMTYERRRSFMFSMLSELDGAVLEYDAVTFYEATFLLELNRFHFILFVIMTDKYPVEQPVLYLESLYCMDLSSDPYRMLVSDFPYDEEWDDGIVIDYMKKGIFKKIDEFQDKSLVTRETNSL